MWRTFGAFTCVCATLTLSETIEHFDACKDEQSEQSLSMLQLRAGPKQNSSDAIAPKLHFLSMGRSGSSFFAGLFGGCPIHTMKSYADDLRCSEHTRRPFLFEPFNENGWGVWGEEAVDAIEKNGWVELSPEAKAQNLRRLRCIYECRGCKNEVSPEFESRTE